MRIYMCPCIYSWVHTFIWWLLVCAKLSLSISKLGENCINIQILFYFVIAFFCIVSVCRHSPYVHMHLYILHVDFARFILLRIIFLLTFYYKYRCEHIQYIIYSILIRQPIFIIGNAYSISIYRKLSP